MKNKSALKHLFILVLILNPFFSFSQLTISNNSSALSLAHSIVGNGVTISNAMITSGSNSSGTFTYNGSNLGLSNGVILTTGSAQGAANGGSYFCNISNGIIFSDPQLTAISPQGKYDVCILEFDFVPLCDTLKINYVFGSEEYPKAIYQAYNDVFGIFLTGPKPGGGNYVSKNIATLPNGITPVSIDSINGGWPIGTNASHFEYYHDNYSSPNNDISYNGYTIPITSKAPLITCASYHIKIAIADGGNALYDSGVFIQGNSMACISPPLVTSSSVYSCYNTGTVSVNVSNYSGIPSYTWFPGNQHSDTLKNIPPGTYTCIIDMPGVCGNYSVSTFVPVSQTVSVETPGQVVCLGKSLQLQANGSLSYTWSPATGLSNINSPNPIATPTITTTYSVAGSSSIGCVTSAAVTLSVSSFGSVPDFSASVYQASIDDPPVQFTASPTSQVHWHWDFGDGGSDSLKEPQHAYNNPGSYIVGLTVSDTNNCSETVYKEIIINDIIKDLYTFYIPNSFTPNGDNMNELFMPKGVGWDPLNYRFDIYNKWGKIIFTTGDSHKGWNGLMDSDTELEADVYTWKINMKDIYHKEHSFIGHVTLVR
ncbi:MAG: choice-of-anchor L domain-containing protein [Bacteroidia bacterium]